MIDCLIVGDSIAVGLAQYKKDCIAVAVGGINSYQWNSQNIQRPMIDMVDYNKVIISLGSNDHEYIDTRKQLEKLRSKIHGKTVYWLMPAIKPNVQDIVLSIARSNGDKIIYLKTLQPDKIHPSAAGYREIVKEIN